MCSGRRRGEPSSDPSLARASCVCRVFVARRGAGVGRLHVFPHGRARAAAGAPPLAPAPPLRLAPLTRPLARAPRFSPEPAAATKLVDLPRKPRGRRVGNKERQKGRRAPTQDPSTHHQSPRVSRLSSRVCFLSFAQITARRPSRATCGPPPCTPAPQDPSTAAAATALRESPTRLPLGVLGWRPLPPPLAALTPGATHPPTRAVSDRRQPPGHARIRHLAKHSMNALRRGPPPASLRLFSACLPLLAAPLLRETVKLTQLQRCFLFAVESLPPNQRARQPACVVCDDVCAGAGVPRLPGQAPGDTRSPPLPLARSRPPPP